MAVEIERRFLVASSDWQLSSSSSYEIRQAYLAITEMISIRVRIKNGLGALLTIKSAQPAIARAEFEYSIPVEDAEQLCEFKLGHLIEKRRYSVPAEWGCWEIDVFDGDLAGLVIAEIELDTPDRDFGQPGWLGEEITSNARYSNASLAVNGLPRDHRRQK
jgi:adenylate cyclase